MLSSQLREATATLQDYGCKVIVFYNNHHMSPSHSGGRGPDVEPGGDVDPGLLLNVTE